MNAGFNSLFQVLAWLVMAVMLPACGPSMEHGPSAAAVAGAAPDVPEAPPSTLGTAPHRGLSMKRGLSPRRIASVRMTERARRLLRSGQYARALIELEKSLSIDGANPYAHYYLALGPSPIGQLQGIAGFPGRDRAHHESRSSMARAEPGSAGRQPAALGRFDSAGAAYRRALSMDPASRPANRGLSWTRQRSRMQSW